MSAQKMDHPGIAPALGGGDHLIRTHMHEICRMVARTVMDYSKKVALGGFRKGGLEWHEERNTKIIGTQRQYI